jgi:MFS family permease
VPVLQRGAVLGIYVATVTLSGVICPAVFGWVVQGGGAGAAGYHTAFLVSGALVLRRGLAGLALINPQREAARVAGLILAAG